MLRASASTAASSLFAAGELSAPASSQWALERLDAISKVIVDTTGPALMSASNKQQPGRRLEAPLASVIRPLIEVYALQGGAEFDDPFSYQSRALDRLADQVGVASMSDAKLIQYYVLYCILEATNGVPNVLTYADPRFDTITEAQFPKWINTNGWIDSSNDWDPCDGKLVSDGSSSTSSNGSSATQGTLIRNGMPWDGITCDATTGQITEVKLVTNLMTGYFPPEIKLLASDGPYSTSGAGNLNYLELYDNEFLFNNFDSSWITDLGSNLEYLYIGFTGFTGIFPQLPVGLIEVDFSYTLLHKELSEDVFAYTPLLEYVNFGGNALNTTLPSSLTSLPNLKFLYVNDCMLRGSLDFLVTMPAIYELWIDVNPLLEGTIPETMDQIASTLASLSLTANRLPGTIPTTLGSLSNLELLWLYDNDFVGTIPTQLGSLPLLKALELEGNKQLAGSMPTEICDRASNWFSRLKTVGGDCDSCICCTCCGLNECQPDLYLFTPAPTQSP